MPDLGQRAGDGLRSQPQLRVGGEKDQRPALCGAAQGHQRLLDRLLVVGLVRLGDVGRQVDQGRALEVKRRADRQLVGFHGRQPPADKVKAAVGGQRRRGENDRLFGVEQVLFHQAADVQRRSVERHPLLVAGHVRPVDLRPVGLGDAGVDLLPVLPQPGQVAGAVLDQPLQVGSLRKPSSSVRPPHSFSRSSATRVSCAERLSQVISTSLQAGWTRRLLVSRSRWS